MSLRVHAYRLAIQYSTLKCEKKHHPTVCLIYYKYWIIEDNNDVFSIQYSVFSIQFSVFSIQYSVFSIQYSVFSIQYSGPVVRVLLIDGLSYGKSCTYCIFSGLLVGEAKTSDDVS